MIQEVTPSRRPEEALASLEPGDAARLIAAAADLAVVIDEAGIVRDLAFGSADLAAQGYSSWIGRPWTETVTSECRPKVEDLLREAQAGTRLRRRQVNHPSPRGADVPVLYGAIRLGTSGPVVALGRDLRPLAALQQQLVSAQQSLEADYASLRQAELRYRVLFQLATEAVLIVDAEHLQVVEANPAAARLFGREPEQLAGSRLTELLAADGVADLETLLARLGAGAPDVAQQPLRLPGSEQPCLVRGSLLRLNRLPHILLQVTPAGAGGPAPVPAARNRLLEVIEELPDGFVVTDPRGTILATNPAFADLAQVADPSALAGQSLERWLGRGGVDLNVLLSNLRRHSAVRLFATTLRDERGGTVEVEISGVAVLEGEPPCLGFTIRDVGRRLNPAGEQLPAAVAQLSELVGRVPMKDLVRETTDLLERLCIEAALQLTGDNRASAAELLGLSRQSLYVKLRRHGIGGLGTGGEKDD